MPVGTLFPEAYRSAHPEFIGSSGVQVSSSEASKLLDLEVEEVPVYGGKGVFDSTIQTLAAALSPSLAVPPAQNPYLVTETDGPKHLYILQLKGDIAAYLGRPPSAVNGKSVIKVGFSKSPLARKGQIQAAYPAGTYQWIVLLPSPVP